MTKVLAFLWLLAFSGFSFLAAQEADSLDWDIDSLFDEPPEGSPPPEAEEPPPAEPITDSLVKRRGYTFDATFDFMGGLAPGYDVAPWHSDSSDDFSFVPAFRMRTNVALDAQISPVFRTRSVVFFQIPNFSFTLGDFFFDYNLYDKIFVRGGKYNHAWGISPNFSFTNLLARVPADGPQGDSFILKFDIPVGVGGAQLLTMTRVDMMNGVIPSKNEVGFGGKYNLALRWVDLDAGGFFQKGMNLRAFLSVKTTLGKTELYNEWLAAADDDELTHPSGAVTLGAIHDFFDNRLTVNMELFYNSEKDVYWYRPETNLQEADTIPFVEGLNGALNLIYRLRTKGSPRFFLQALYAPLQYSARIVPGFTLKPWEHTELYFGVPMALGRKDGYYYKHTPDYENRPFSVMILLTLNGGIQLGRYDD